MKEKQRNLDSMDMEKKIIPGTVNVTRFSL